MSHQHASKEAAQEPTQHTTAKPFKLSPEESEIVQVWRKFDSFDSHRHHSGHQHPPFNPDAFKKFASKDYKMSLPETLLVLKKIDAINPTIMKQQQKRLLQPVTPGIISNYGKIILMSAFGITVSTFFIRFGIIRSCKNKLFLMATCGLFLSINMFEELALRTREATYYSSRKNLADKYLAIYGEQQFKQMILPNYRPQKP